ncbi:hypothetical protein BO94DRAFT_546811 [Aspergillus sclerotioniger CBS 115572]|uniref:Uncharacterized protein n=1 Tax=Aspergillus sclerotioniger CBS 115572 TaxID=1450535 RepID=A0A317WNF7_9EURO|nr:hypothetical protein BO94DRAFT_546811 [Aspergillus sclerotioniger CBS 115572]PWY86587.1 hypothetical protein BO94DRAFT_546811 [Aspergillus sclerotioniger CBS 115572]
MTTSIDPSEPLGPKTDGLIRKYLHDRRISCSLYRGRPPHRSRAMIYSYVCLDCDYTDPWEQADHLEPAIEKLAEDKAFLKVFYYCDPEMYECTCTEPLREFLGLEQYFPVFHCHALRDKRLTVAFVPESEILKVGLQANYGERDASISLLEGAIGLRRKMI